MIAIGCLYLYGLLVLTVIRSVNEVTFRKYEKKTLTDLQSRAKKILETDHRVRKIYFTLRVMHLKNKNSNKINLLEQQLRNLVREKVVRQEILHMVRAKPPK